MHTTAQAALPQLMAAFAEPGSAQAAAHALHGEAMLCQSLQVGA